LTKALCLYCGEIKFGAFVECPACGNVPRTSGELAEALGFTDHYFPSEFLDGLQEFFRSGHKLELDPELYEKLLTTVQNDRTMQLLLQKLQQMPRGGPKQEFTKQTMQLSFIPDADQAANEQIVEGADRYDDAFPTGSTSGNDKTLIAGLVVFAIGLVIFGIYTANKPPESFSTPIHKYPVAVEKKQPQPDYNRPPRQTQPLPTQRTQPAPPRFNKPLVPLPPNGFAEWYTNASRPTKLTIKTSSRNNHHYIKLVGVSTAQPILTIFVRSGQTAEIPVPFGTYQFRYATGKNWYGKEILFGPDTEYYQTADANEFTSRINNGRSEYTHLTIELIEQIGGNLETSEIRPDEW
jgi:hypothetical protein